MMANIAGFIEEQEKKNLIKDNLFHLQARVI